MRGGSLKFRFVSGLQVGLRRSTPVGILLLMGAFFWGAPMYRAFSGPEQVGSREQSRPLANTPDERSAPPTTEVVATTYTWQTIDGAMETDPLVKSVEVAAFRSDPFRTEMNESPAALSPRETSDHVLVAAQMPDPAMRAELDGLVLRSTIVGIQRRAALINNRLYYEGREIEWNGASYLLSAVYPSKIILTCGTESIELKIPRRETTDPQFDHP